MEAVVAGPKQRIEQNYKEEPADSFFTAAHEFPEVWTTFVPDMWDMPVANKFTVDLPEDAHPGTYVAVVKATRRYLGETTHRTKVVDFQVGTREVTAYNGRFGNCEVCHIENAVLDRLRHGVRSFNVCSICHTRPHGIIAEHLHTIHYFSSDFMVTRSDCSLCHLQHDSNTRASQAVCSSCHGNIHKDELFMEGHDSYAQCGILCHKDTSTGHVPLPPL
jgi:hypothetical protein